nr:sulfatase [Cellulophaga sp. F20128]
MFLKTNGQSASDKPNIVWLVSEDNSTHYLQLYQEGGAELPHIEALAKKGVVFNNAFSNAPVCSVARSTIISGCYAPRIGAQYHRKTKLAPLPTGLKMFPHYLRTAGYYTTNNAKEDYNLIKSDDVWDDSSRKASYKNRTAGQPFFHVQNFGVTHEGSLHFPESQIVDQPEQNVFPFHPNTPTFRFTNSVYLEKHKALDEQIGAFLKELEKNGELDNTIIFYYGDHGGVLPRSKGYLYETGLHVPMVAYAPEKWKHLLPFKTGTRTDTFVEFIDLGPTVLHLAGIPIPEEMDGRPFLGKGITLANLENKNTAFGYADRFDEKYDLVRSLRKLKYKYIRNYQPFNIDGLFNFYRYKMAAYKEWEDLFKAGSLNQIQQQFFRKRDAEALYDLENDPYETHNLANKSEYQYVLQDLRASLKQKVIAMPDLSFYPESYFLEEGLSNPVLFGQNNKENIADLVAIADLEYLPFSKAKSKINEALKSTDPWKRYWGLIVCTSFGQKAQTFYRKAHKIAALDNNGLVRMRAAEFLALSGQHVPKALFIDILKNATSEAEANLMLNSVALIKTMLPEFELNIPKSLFNQEWVAKEGDVLLRRINFINEN